MIPKQTKAMVQQGIISCFGLHQGNWNTNMHNINNHLHIFSLHLQQKLLSKVMYLSVFIFEIKNS